MSATIRVGLIGLGWLGARHARHIAAGRHGTRAVLASSGERSRHVADEVGAPWTADWTAVVDDPAVDAVVAAVTSRIHPAIIEACASAGKPLFVEKMIALDVPSGLRAVEAAKRAGILVQVGFQRRSDAAYLRARAAIDAGEIGTPIAAFSCTRDPRGISSVSVDSGGLLMDLLGHDYDACRWLIGDEPVSVYAEARCMVQPELEAQGDFDHARVLVSFAGGASGLAEASRFARYGYDIRAEVEGSLGEVEILGAETIPFIVRTEASARSEVTPRLRDEWFWNRFQDAFGRELDTFIDAVRGTAKPAATLDDGLAALRIGAAAIRSVQEGRPISLEELQ
ncbi:MAG TPA: Gfo/Idh/MocA family oxidoreductase [Candidatus Limnocylindrales bacterium]